MLPSIRAFGQQLRARPGASAVGAGSRRLVFARLMPGLLLLIACLGPGLLLAGAALVPPAGKSAASAVPESTGPTLHLSCGRGKASGNPVAEFMYFVPLISMEPVSVVKSAGNTQRARMVSATRSFTARSFLVTCEFEFSGEGTQQNIIDHAAKVRRHASALKAGGSLDHQLGSINVQGAGSVSIKVEGTVRAQVPTVTEVRLRFNGHGRASPVTITLYDIGYSDGAFQRRNESVANVSTLVFRRDSGPARMDITVASVKRKGASDNFWQNLMGSLKATTANLLLKPIAVEPAGNEAMLNFGLALASNARSFTFPRARNLQVGSGASGQEGMASK